MNERKRRSKTEAFAALTCLSTWALSYATSFKSKIDNTDNLDLKDLHVILARMNHAAINSYLPTSKTSRLRSISQVSLRLPHRPVTSANSAVEMEYVWQHRNGGMTWSKRFKVMMCMSWRRQKHHFPRRLVDEPGSAVDGLLTITSLDLYPRKCPKYKVSPPSAPKRFPSRVSVKSQLITHHSSISGFSSLFISIIRSTKCISHSPSFSFP